MDQEDHTPGFERPDVDSLRESFHGPSLGERIAFRFRQAAGSRMFRTIVLALLIVAAIAIGLWLLF